MKITRLFLLAAIFMCSLGISHAASSIDADGRILLTNDEPGDLNTGGEPRSSKQLTAYLTPNKCIEACFGANIGIVQITIKDNNGAVVYNKLANTFSINYLYINILNLPTNAYKISFKNMDGNSIMTSSFYINRQ